MDVMANVEDSIGSLFREIGSTLVDVTKSGVSTVKDTVKTALAKQIMGSPQGQAEISAYKAEYLLKYLPWMALVAVLLFLGGRYVHR